MKKKVCMCLVMCVGALASAAYEGAVLFSDSYDRPNNTNISASTVGMSGLLAPLTYVEAFEGSGQPTSIQILNNQLNVAVGPGMSSLFLDYNLIDEAILAADGFSVSLEVVRIQVADDEANRFGGFGVGNTRAEALAARDSQDHVAPLRPTTGRANQGVGVSDFYVDLALDNNLRLWSNGNLLETIPVGVNSGTIHVDFYVTDFNAGSVAAAAVYFNGVYLSMQKFAWDNTDANYLAFSGRTPGEGVFLDNLRIATFYENRAHQPVPADGAIDVNPAEVVLQWNKGKDAQGNPNSAIAQHYLYMIDGEPNFVGVSPIVVPDTEDPVQYHPALSLNDTDKIYFWRVDESVRVNGIPTAPDDPNTITGFVWSFETIKSVPIITSQPTNVLTEVGQTTEFSVSVTSFSPVSYHWYKTTDKTIDTPDDDVLAGQDEVLVIAPVQAADEGYYYCKVINASGEQNAAYSTVVKLGVKRQVAHWTLDWADYVDGLYLDSSGEGHHAEPNLLPDASQFVAGANPAKTGEALDLVVKPLSAAYAGDWAAAACTNQVTVSAWVKWNGPNGAWQGIVSNRVTPTDGNFYFEIRQDNGNVQFAGPNFNLLESVNLPVGQWTHLAVTACTEGIVIYMDGLPVASRFPAMNASIGEKVVPMFIAALGRPDGLTLASPFNGVIDDVRIYNFAKDRFGVADLYYEVTEIPLCLNPDDLDLRFDVTGDCRVGLDDFAMFAGTWLNCGLYPVCP